MKKFRLPATVLFISLFLFSCTESTPSLIDEIIDTESGALAGAINQDATVLAFKGIPYAAAPVGDLRWKEPQAPVPWEGVRDATGFCNSCMQNLKYSHLPNGPWTEEFMVQDSVSEDCLFLNIWTPAASASDSLPVLVYIHGGALTEGSGSIEVYDGEALARKGILVITINYRLGPFGFLVHPDLTAESPHHASGNYGFLDQVAALKWIQKNIAAFGGNPSRVTIAGQSAGASSVNALIASPLAKGLFHGAITQSGTTLTRNLSGSRSLDAAEAQGLEFASSKGAGSITELRALSAEEILSQEPDSPYFRFGGVKDGYFQVDEPRKIFIDGKQNDTPFMSGMNADETRYFGDQGEAFKSLYPSENEEEMAASLKMAGQEQSRLNTYLWMEFRSRTAATKSYEYFFDRAIPWPEYPQFGAFHTAEVPYVFNNISKLTRHHVMEKADTLIADQMSSYWANFVKTGDPNGPGLPAWDGYHDSKQEVMRLGEDMGMMPVAGSGERFDFLKNQLLDALKPAEN